MCNLCTVLGNGIRCGEGAVCSNSSSDHNRGNQIGGTLVFFGFCECNDPSSPTSHLSLRFVEMSGGFLKMYAPRQLSAGKIEIVINENIVLRRGTGCLLVVSGLKH